MPLDVDLLARPHDNPVRHSGQPPVRHHLGELSALLGDPQAADLEYGRLVPEMTVRLAAIDRDLLPPPVPVR
jgi:hypothetical protein